MDTGMALFPKSGPPVGNHLRTLWGVFIFRSRWIRSGDDGLYHTVGFHLTVDSNYFMETPKVIPWETLGPWGITFEFGGASFSGSLGVVADGRHHYSWQSDASSELLLLYDSSRVF